MSEAEYQMIEDLYAEVGREILLEATVECGRPWSSAIAWLEAGLSVRRLGWHQRALCVSQMPGSRFLRLTSDRGDCTVHTVWRPYLEDFSATDWVLWP